mgnify:CR=1 FL=1
MKYLGEQLSTFNKQMEYAMANYQSHGKKIGQFKNIVISGLGGSGITGKIIKSYYLDKININYLATLVVKAEPMIKRKIRYTVYSSTEYTTINTSANNKKLLIWSK